MLGEHLVEVGWESWLWWMICDYHGNDWLPSWLLRVNIQRKVGDHPWDGEWLSWGGWVTIHGNFCDQHWYFCWPSWGWWVSILRIVSARPQIMVDECPQDGRWQFWGWWMTVLWNLGDQPREVGWPYFGWGVTILGMVGEPPGDSGWPSIAVVTWY